MTFEEKLRELHEAATESPWAAEPYSQMAGYPPTRIVWFGDTAEEDSSDLLERDARLIAFTRNAVPAILEVLGLVRCLHIETDRPHGDCPSPQLCRALQDLDHLGALESEPLP